MIKKHRVLLAPVESRSGGCLYMNVIDNLPHLSPVQLPLRDNNPHHLYILSGEGQTVATSDREAGLPILSEAFTLKYAEKFNRGKQIEHVMVEYIDTTCNVLKLSPGNHVTVRKVKEAWSPEEITELFKKHGRERDIPAADIERWLENNL